MSNVEAADAKPAIVLVHGAFTESSSWQGVITGLLEHGYPVVAIANPLRGVKHDSDYLRSVLDGIDGEIVLVGHGYGGTVITNGGAGDPRIKALVYVSGYAPDTRETVAGLTERFAGAMILDMLTAVKLPEGGADLYIRQDQYRRQIAFDSRVREAAVMAVTQRPIAEPALDEPSLEAAWKTVPSWFLFGGDDRAIPVAAHRFMAERAGSRRTVELRGGSHTVGIAQTATTISLILEAADSMAGDAARSDADIGEPAARHAGARGPRAPWDAI